MFPTSEIEKWQPIRALLEEYEQAREEVAEGFRLLASAKQRMKKFGEYRDHLWNGDLRDYHLEDGGAAKDALEIMKRNAWAGIVDKAMIRELLSEKRCQELDSQLSGERNRYSFSSDNPPPLPDLTIENVMSFLENLHGNMGNLLQETVKEVFDILRPPRSEHKTNTEFEVGERVILTWVFEWGGSHLRYDRDAKIRSIDSVFHLLDGKGPVKYPGDAITQIRQALQEKRSKCETEYFEFVWYKNGNLHIRFKRMDLVRELNRRAGGNMVKPHVEPKRQKKSALDTILERRPE